MCTEMSFIKKFDRASFVHSFISYWLILVIGAKDPEPIPEAQYVRCEIHHGWDLRLS